MIWKFTRTHLLKDGERAEFFQAAVDLMTGAGYLQYEISTFAKPGFESKHNLIYWRNEEYLGLGPGAYSYLNGIRGQFAPDMGRYLLKCESGDWKLDLADFLTDEEKETETLITGLRLPAGVDLESFPIIRKRLEPRVRELSSDKLLTVQGNRIALTAQGRALVETTFKFLIGKD
jgi:oxygen-independent coproporphyrinogen III oxidase